MCVCVCAYICTHMYVHMCRHVYIHVHIYMKKSSLPLRRTKSKLVFRRSQRYLVVISFKYNLLQVAAHASAHERALVSAGCRPFIHLSPLCCRLQPVTDFLSIRRSDWLGTRGAPSSAFFFNPQSYVEVLTCEKGLKAKNTAVCASVCPRYADISKISHNRRRKREKKKEREPL